MNILIYSAIAMISSIIVSYILMKQLLKVCYEKQIFDRIDDRRVHSNHIPRLGGVVFMPAASIGTLCALIVMKLVDNSFISTISTSNIMICIGMLAIYLIGVADDIIECNAKLKFAVQVCAAITFPICGLYINNLYGFMGIYELPVWIAYALTIFIAVLIINAINLIDGIDGLAAMLTLFALAIYGWRFYEMSIPIFNIMIFALGGCLLAYLPFNMLGKAEKGSKTFMGDSGSLLLGMTLAYLSIKFLMDNPTALPYREDAFVVALSAILIPCFDLTRVALCRLCRGKGIFTPDKTHIHHKLMAKGMNMHQALFTILCMQAAFFAINLVMMHLGVQITWIALADAALYSIINVYLPINQ